MKRAIAKYTHRLLTLLVFLGKRFLAEGLSDRAASLAYTTLLSIVPLAFLGFSLLSFFPAFQGVSQVLQHWIFSNFVTSSAFAVSTYLNDFLQHAHTLSPINLIFLLIIGLLMAYNIHQAFNTVWRVEREFRFSVAILIYLLILIGFPIIFGGFFVFGAFLAKWQAIMGVMNAINLQRWFSKLLPYFISISAFTFCHWILPSVKVRFFHALLGGVVTAILFELAKLGFAVYVSHFASYRLLYGAVATVPIFLVWLYIAWVIILVGALLTHTVAQGVVFWHKTE